MSTQYTTGYSRSANTFSSGGKDSLCFSVVRGGISCPLPVKCADCECNGLGVVKRNPTKACNYYPNWWKTSSCCDNPCPIGSEGCAQELINTCPNYDADDAQATSSNITSVIGVVNKVLDETEGDIDDEAADRLIALMREATE